MAMDSFSYTDNVRAVFSSCLPCFSVRSPSEPLSNPPSNAANTSLSNPLRSTSTNARSPSSNDLEHLLRDADSDGISLNSNLGAASRRGARRRRRPNFSLTLFGYTLFGRPPIYLSDDDEDDPEETRGRRGRALITNSSSTLDSDAAPLDASTIDRLTSPDHFAALAAQRESERQRLEAEEDARRKAERRARRQERKARERADALIALNGASSHPEMGTFEGFQGSGSGVVPTQGSLDHLAPVRFARSNDLDGSNTLYSGDADDADLGGELYARKKMTSGALSGSGSDSRSRTSASFSAGDSSHTQNPLAQLSYQSVPYPHTEMHVPAPAKKKANHASKRTSTISSATSQSTAPYTPVEIFGGTPSVTALSQEHHFHDGEQSNFPSVGLSGERRPKSLDPKAFLALQG